MFLCRQQHNFSAHSPQFGSYFSPIKNTKLSLITPGRQFLPTVSNLEILKNLNAFPRKGGGSGWRKTTETSRYRQLSIDTHEHWIGKVIFSPPSIIVPEEVVPPTSARTAQVYADTSLRVWTRLHGISQAQLTVSICTVPSARHSLQPKARRFLLGLKRSPAKQQDRTGVWATAGISVQYYFPGIRFCLRSCRRLSSSSSLELNVPPP